MLTEAHGYSHIVVLDFEATCDDANPPRPQEIIEFPSVLLDGKTFEVVDEFEAFVRPVHHPRLTAFCTQLTSITQAQVEGAEPFPAVLAAWLAWLQSHGLPIHGELPYVVVTCGDWDLRRMLPTQLRASGLDAVPGPFRQWMNAKVPFKRLFPELRCGMVGMLDALGLPLVGTHHRGIDDSRNIAKIVAALAERGQPPQITATLATSGHPPLVVVLERDGQRIEVSLGKRRIQSLLGLASGAFRRQANRAFHEGKALRLDSDLFDLRRGAVVQVY